MTRRADALEHGAMPAAAVDPDVDRKIAPPPVDRPRIAPAHVEMLKRTRSVCPRCLRIVDADVGIDDGAVWMHKACPEHGPFQGFIESSVEFYRATMNRTSRSPRPYQSLVIPVTHRCNLNCTLCFVPRRDRHDLPLPAVCRIIDAFPGGIIALSGGEPTLREDLPQIIRYARSAGKWCQILTNAVRLARPDYVRLLADAGLRDVLFSLNSFREEVYLRLNGRRLLDLKLEALENCVREGLSIAVSPMIIRDLNDDEIPAFVQLCLDHAPSTYELRIRGACRVGRHEKIQPLSTCELFESVAGALGRDVSAFLAELRSQPCYHSVIQFNLFGVFDASGPREELAWWHSPELLRPDDFLDLPQLPDRHKTLTIHTWGWPTAANIDFQEIQGHGVCHLYESSKPMNFCEATLRADRL